MRACHCLSRWAAPNAAAWPFCLLLLAACGGGGSGAGASTPAPPASLSYASNPANYTVGTAITPDVPTSTGGAVGTYGISPALPAGLGLNASTGVISGTPTVVAPQAVYTVTAANAGGSTSASLTLGVSRAILAFAVGPDQTLAYPNSTSLSPYLVDLSDEHTTIFPPAAGSNAYLVFAASRLSGGTGGAVVLQTSDLVNFSFATSLGYADQVLASPLAINQCDATHGAEFDGNYAAPGSVLQDPTLPAGNLIMLYEAENHCPGGTLSSPFYATIGFARSADNGKTWPAPVNSALGDATRHPVLKGADPQPAAPGYLAMGDAIPAAFAERDLDGKAYVYVVYGYHTGTAGTSDGQLRIARAALGADPVTFLKWSGGSFSQPGIGGSDSRITPAPGCTNGYQTMADLSYNDDLAAYLLVFVCANTPMGSQPAAWYYATATSLDRQDWSAPKLIQNSQFTLTSPCPTLSSGGQFDGWYPSLMSPGAASGHTRLGGTVFYMNGCDVGQRQFMARNFTITTGP